MTQCPFPGLLPFREQDAPFFFGRDREIAELLSRLQRQRFVDVLGVSGSGKSSLVHAGIKPELRAQGWRIVEMRPGNAPAAHLAAELSKELPGQDWADLLSGSSYGLSDGIGRALPGPDARLLIIVDQFEEIFEYWGKDPGKADLFVQQILRAASLPGLAAYVVITMRTDFLGRCSLFRNLPEALNEASYLVPRLTRKEQEEAIRLPLAVSGVEIEPGVVDDLLNASEKHRDELPVLQHLLKRLWEECGGTGTIGRAQLARTGGWEEAISRDAGGVFDPLNAGEKDAVRLVFQRITKKGTGERPVRTPCGFGELAAICGPVAGRERLLELMGEFRKRDLLVWETEERIDIPHECLTWRWQSLAGWIEEEDRDRQLLDFVAASRRGNLPLAGFKLDEARLVQARLDGKEWAARYGHDARELREWIELSVQRQSDAGRNRKLVVAGLAAVALFFAGLFAWAQAQKHEADKARTETAAANTKLKKANEELREQAQQNETINEQLSQTNRKLAKTVEAEEEARSSTAVQRIKGVWQSASRQAARDADGHIDDDRSALLARQAFLFHRLTPSEPRYLIEEALQKSVSPSVFSHVLSGHQGYVYSVAFSPDGTRIASAGYDSTVRLWNLNQPGLTPEILSGHKGHVFSVAFSPDGKQLASGSEDGTLRVWDLGRPIRQAHVISGNEHVGRVAFSPDGTRLASIGTSGVVIADLRQNSLSSSFSAPKGHAAFSRDGRYLAVPSSAATVEIWDLNSMKSPPRAVAGCSRATDSLAFSDDGAMLACAGATGVSLVSLRQPQTKVITKDSSLTFSMAFSPDAKKLAVAGQELRVWDLGHPQAPPLVLIGHHDIVISVAFSPDGARLASSSKDGAVRIWDLTSTRLEQHILNGHEGYVLSVAFSPNGTELASASADRTVRVWNTRDVKARPLILPGHLAPVTSVAFSPRDGSVASGSDDKSVRLWSLRRLQDTRVLPGHSGQVRSVSFSPNGSRLASGSADKTVRVWSLTDPETPPQIITGHEASINSVAISPDGAFVASGSDDRTVRIWKLVDTDNAPSALFLHGSGVRSVAFSPDGKQLASGAWDQTVRLWDLRHPAASPKIMPVSPESLEGVVSVAFSPDGTALASASWDQEIRLWDLTQPNAKPITLLGHRGYVHSVAFSPDGGLLASGGEDMSVRLWPIWQRAAETICGRVWRNLSMEEWKLYIGEGIPYERTCPNLPAGAGAPQ